MKIASIVVHRLSVPLRRPVRTAIHDLTHAHTVLVEMQSDAGLVGSGYCFAFGRRAAGALHELVLDLAPLYEGKDPVEVRAHHAAAWRALTFLGHAGAGMMALAALDVACWDLAARSADLPLYRRSEEHTSELQSHVNIVCRLLLEKKKLRDGQRRD